MPFVCPHCARRALEIRIALRLPPDDYSDERSLQLLRCAACEEDVAGVYECSRRGADERWHHAGYRVQKSRLAKLWSAAEVCPNPDDKRCDCAAHRWLERESLGEDWFELRDR